MPVGSHSLIRNMQCSTSVCNVDPTQRGCINQIQRLLVIFWWNNSFTDLEQRNSATCVILCCYSSRQPQRDLYADSCHLTTWCQCAPLVKGRFKSGARHITFLHVMSSWMMIGSRPKPFHGMGYGSGKKSAHCLTAVRQFVALNVLLLATFLYQRHGIREMTSKADSLIWLFPFLVWLPKSNNTIKVPEWKHFS